MNRAIGCLIRQLESKALSQEQLAEIAGIDRTYISGIERCRRNLTIKPLSKIIPAVSDGEEDFFRKLVKAMSSAE